jgi:hypothetical protein
VGRRLSVADLAQSRQGGHAPAAGRAITFARYAVDGFRKQDERSD